MSAVPTVTMTSHLHRFFPQLADCAIEVPAGSVADVVRAVDGMAPGFADYIVDEHGALRRHVLISVDNAMVVDRRALSDKVSDDGSVHIFQSLTGG